MILKIAIVFICIVLFKVIYNLYYFLLAKKYLKEYLNYVKNQNNWSIRENRQKIIKVLEKAGIEDSDQPVTEPAGYGFVRSSSFSVFKNIAVLRRDVVEIINGDLREAVNVYKSRIFESFNSIYWVELIIFLPRVLLSYLGVSAGSIFIKIIQLLWWILAFASTLVGIFFNKEFSAWIGKFL